MGPLLVLLLSCSYIVFADIATDKQYEDRARRGAPSTFLPRWELPVPYRILDDFNASQKAMIKHAIATIMEDTCIDFKEDSSNGFMLEYTLVPPTEKCQSMVGDSRYAYGPGFERDHEIYLAPECVNLRTVAHETLHALGLEHTQSRADREKYLIVDMDKIADDMKLNYRLMAQKDSPDYGIPFEFGSLMMYPAKTFMIPRYDETLKTSMGASPTLTFYDYKILNMHYNCSKKCASPIECKNGGYPHPRDCDRCLCGAFHDGKNCEIERGLVSLQAESDVEVQTINRTVDSIYDFPQPSDWVNYNVEPLRVIKAPANRRIRVTIEQQNVFGDLPQEGMGYYPCLYGSPWTCDEFAVEIADEDLKSTGRKFCCNATSYLSKSNVIGYRAYSLKGLHFSTTVTFKLEPESDVPVTDPTTTTTTTEAQPVTTTTTTADPTTATTTTDERVTTTTTTTDPITTTTTTTPSSEPETTTMTTADPTTTTTTTDEPITTTTTTTGPIITTTTMTSTAEPDTTTTTTDPPTTTPTPDSTTTTATSTTTAQFIPVKPIPEKPEFADGQCVKWIVFTYNEPTGICFANATQICNDQDYEAAQEKSYANCKKNAPHITPDPPRTECKNGLLFERVRGEPIDALYGRLCKDDFCSYGSTCVQEKFPMDDPKHAIAHCCTLARWS